MIELMWLLSVRTALSLIGAPAGIALAYKFKGLPRLVAVIVGALVGSAIAGLALSPVAERVDRALHRVGGPRSGADRAARSGTGCAKNRAVG